jgi:hypothetical protein
MNWSACMLLKGWHKTCNNMCTVLPWAAATRILWTVPWSAVLIQIVLAVSTPSRNPGVSSYGAQFQSDAAARELIYSGSLLCSKNAAGVVSCLPLQPDPFPRILQLDMFARSSGFQDSWYMQGFQESAEWVDQSDRARVLWKMTEPTRRANRAE